MRYGTESQVSAGLVSSGLVGHCIGRKKITISVPSGTEITVSTKNPAVLGTGFTWSNAVAPVCI